MGKLVKKKRLCSYHKQWEAKEKQVKPVRGGQTKTFPTLGRRGENDMTQHAKALSTKASWQPY